MMLKIDVLTVGKVKTPWIKEGIDYYGKLAGKYADITLIRVKEGGNGRLSEESVIRIEGERLDDQLHDDAYCIVLDPAGETLSSEKFARLIESRKRDYSRIQFVIGGAFGLDVGIVASGDMMLSLSKMTFPHELTQLLLMEQLFRALSISAGSKYHK